MLLLFCFYFVYAHDQLGILDEFCVAFSRLGSRKVYVQHMLREKSKDVSNMILNEKAYIFVCGDASHMAKDVENAIIDILALHNEKMDKREATKYVKTMQQQGRYMQDIWSSIIVDKGKPKKQGPVSKQQQTKQILADLDTHSLDGAEENQKDNDSDI